MDDQRTENVLDESTSLTLTSARLTIGLDSFQEGNNFAFLLILIINYDCLLINRPINFQAVALRRKALE